MAADCGPYWSSSEVVGLDSAAWFVDFEGAAVAASTKRGFNRILDRKSVV
jgi:hypothetical protein